MDGQDRVDPSLQPRYRTSVQQVTLAGLVAFTLFSLMNAPTLLRLVLRQPVGWWRSVELPLVHRLERVSHALWLDRPRLAADRALGRGFGTAATFDRLAAANAQPRDADGTKLPPASADDPLDLWIIGDSQARRLGEALMRRALASGVMKATVDSRLATGLSRSDYFDWPSTIQTFVESNRPDAVVTIFGANDPQTLQLDTGVFAAGDSGWLEEYSRRTDIVMSYFERQGIRVYWIGQPISSRVVLTRRMREENAIYAERASMHPNTVYIPLWELFLDADGRYASYLRDGEGALVQMRTDDGVHLTRAGAERAADVIFPRIVADLPQGKDEGASHESRVMRGRFSRNGP